MVWFLGCCDARSEWSSEHLHDVRCMWLKSLCKDHGITVPLPSTTASRRATYCFPPEFLEVSYEYDFAA